MNEITTTAETSEQVVIDVGVLIESAKESIGAFDYNEAIKTLDAASAALKKMERDEDYIRKEIEIIALRAKIDWILGRWEEALIHYNTIIDKKDLAPDKVPVVHAYLGKGEIMGNQGHYRDAVDILKDGLALADSIGDKKEIANCCYSLGMFYSRIGESVSGKKLLERSQRIAEGSPDEPGMKAILAANYNQMGLIHFRNRQLEEAQACFKKTLQLLDECPYSLERAEALRYLGVTSSVLNDYKSAMKSHYEALRIYKHIEYRFGQAKVYNSIGQACSEIGKLDIAIHYMEKAEAICRELKADAEAATIYGKLGNVYMMKEEYDRAKAFFTKDIEMSKRFDNIRALAFAHRNIGECNIYLGRNEEAIENLRHSAELFRKIGDSVNEKKVKLTLCTAYINDGNLEDAEKTAQKLREMIPEKEKSQDAGIMLMLLGIIERHKKNWADSSKYLNDSVAMLKTYGKSLKLSESYYEYGLMCLGIHDNEGAISKFREAFKIARDLGLSRQKDRYFKMIERIDELEIVKLLIEELE